MDENIKAKILNVLNKESIKKDMASIFPQIDIEKETYFKDYNRCLHIADSSLCEYSPETIGDLRNSLQKIAHVDDGFSEFTSAMILAISACQDTSEREKAVDLYNYMM